MFKINIFAKFANAIVADTLRKLSTGIDGQDGFITNRTLDWHVLFVKKNNRKNQFLFIRFKISKLKFIFCDIAKDIKNY